MAAARKNDAAAQSAAPAMTGNEERRLGPFLATMVVASSMIGSGIFLLPASLAAFGSISMVAWVLALVAAAVIGGVFSALAVLSPATAGLFSYVRDAFGDGAGFVAAVLYWASCMVATVAIGLAVTGYLGFFLPVVARPPGITVATIAVTWLLTGTNMIGPRFVARMQSLTLALGLVPVLLAAFGGWFFFHANTFAQSWNVTGASVLSVVPRATVIAFWAFVGIEAGIVLSARVINPARNVPIGTLGGVAISGAIYMSACAAIMGILPASVLAKSSAPFADATAPILGSAAAAVVALCAMLKSSGTLAANILVTLESAESESVLGLVRSGPARPSARASMWNLIFTGALASLIVIASQSPTLARQFTIVANVSVVLSVMVYLAASLALLRLSGTLSGARRTGLRCLGFAGALTSAALIAVSEPDLLVWSAGTTLIALIGYLAIRLKRSESVKESKQPRSSRRHAN